jgi:hypothetical protein
MQVAGVGVFPAAGQTTSPAVAAAVAPAASPATSTGDSPEATLLAYFRMTPAQKMRFDIMSQMGVTQDDYNKMTAAQKAVIDAEIKQKMKDEIQKMTENKTGLIVDMQA